MNRATEELHPAVARRCGALLSICKARGIKLLVTSTLRTEAEQRALYAQGRESLHIVNALRAEAGLGPIREGANRVVTCATVSLHQFGCAFDIAVLKDGKVTWGGPSGAGENPLGDYEEAGRLGESLGLTWGGRFGIRDFCHFQYTGGLSLDELQAGMIPHDRAGSAGSDNIKNPSFEGPERGEDAPLNKNFLEADMTKIKSGLKTSEFYLALMGAVIPVFNTHLGLNIPMEAVLSISGIIISYIISRAVVKRQAE